MRRGSQHQVRSAPFRVCVTAVGAESEDVVVSASCSARGAKLSVLSTAYVKTEHLALNCGTPFRASFDGPVHRRLCKRIDAWSTRKAAKRRRPLSRRRNCSGVNGVHDRQGSCAAVLRPSGVREANWNASVSGFAQGGDIGEV